MAKTATLLLELSAAHAYYAGTEVAFAEWSPSPATAELLRRQRMIFKAFANKAMVAVEIGGDGKPMVAIPPEMVLTFFMHAAAPEMASVTKLPEGWSGCFVFSNKAGTVGTNGQVHVGTEVPAASQAQFCGLGIPLNLPATAATHSVALQSSAGEVVFSEQVAAADGRVKAIARLTGPEPGLLDVLLDGLRIGRIFATVAASATRPVTVVQLSARAGAEAGFEFVDPSGGVLSPVPAYSIAFGAYTPKWRYVVVPRHASGVVAADLQIIEKTAGQFSFGAATAVSLSDGAQAFALDSTKSVPLSATGIRGLALQRKKSTGPGFDTVYADLPNPRPEARSSEVPDTSQVFLYV